MRRIIGIAAVGALAASGLGLAGPAQAIAPRTQALAGTSTTNFAFEATGFGTKVHGGDIPAASGRTAFSHLGCTRKAGLNKANHVAGINLDSLADAKVIRSRSWTTTSHGVTAANSTSSIAKLHIGHANSADLLGRLTINGIVATTRSWHSASGYHASATTKIASVDLNILGAHTSLPVPTRGHPTTVADLAKLSVGARHRLTGGSYAAARAVSLKITVIPTSTKITAGYASSRIDGSVTGGIFHGYANGSQVRLLGNTVTSGRTSLQPMPCAGTRGKVLRTSTASVNALKAARLHGLKSSVYGVQMGRSASGYALAKVVKTVLLKRIRISGVVARANVTLRANGRVVRSDHGTKLAGVFLDGNRLKLGTDGKRKIGKLAVVSSGVVDRTKNGIDVVGVRIKLLSGAGAHAGSVIDLAHAKLSITRS